MVKMFYRTNGVIMGDYRLNVSKNEMCALEVHLCTAGLIYMKYFYKYFQLNSLVN